MDLLGVNRGCLMYMLQTIDFFSTFSLLHNICITLKLSKVVSNQLFHFILKSVMMVNFVST